MSKHINEIEKKILAGINSINNKTKTPKEASLGVLINRMKKLDEPLHNELMDKYKSAVKKFNE